MASLGLNELNQIWIQDMGESIEKVMSFWRNYLHPLHRTFSFGNFRAMTKISPKTMTSVFSVFTSYCLIWMLWCDYACPKSILVEHISVFFFWIKDVSRPYWVDVVDTGKCPIPQSTSYASTVVQHWQSYYITREHSVQPTDQTHEKFFHL